MCPMRCGCHAVLDEDCLIHERVRDCGSVEVKLLVAISYPNWDFPWTPWHSCLLIPSLLQMLSAQRNSLHYINAAYFPKAGYTMNNVHGRWGELRYCRKFAESISAEADVCIWVIYQFILDPFWIHRAITRDTEREAMLSQESGIITLDVILQLNITVVATSFLSTTQKSSHMRMRAWEISKNMCSPLTHLLETFKSMPAEKSHPSLASMGKHIEI